MTVGCLPGRAAVAEQRWNDIVLAGRQHAPRTAFWDYEQPAVVLGRAQRSLVPAVRARASKGCEVIARQSGGAAVLAGPWMLSTSLVLPRSHPGARGVAQAFGLVADAHLDVLAGLGVAARRVGDEARSLAGVPSVDWACFGSIAPHEIVAADDRKLVGLAQVRRATGTLVVAGLLLAPPPWAMLCTAMAAAPADAGVLEARTTAIAAILRAVPQPAELARRLDVALGRTLQMADDDALGRAA
jgi:lipoate-protein ligase A